MRWWSPAISPSTDARGVPAVRAIVEPVPDRLGVPVVYAAGNHDDREAFRAHLLDEAPSREPLDQVVRVGTLRIIVLDSTVPGQAHGSLRPGQLAWLRAELAEPVPAGTVLALHHPPLPSAAPLAASIPLLHREELGDAIAGPDVSWCSPATRTSPARERSANPRLDGRADRHHHRRLHAGTALALSRHRR